MFIISGSPLFHWPLPPLSYRFGVLRVMAVGIEPEAMPEARLPREVLFGHASDAVDESAERFLHIPQDLGDRHAPFLFRPLPIEGVDAAVLYVSPSPASWDND